MAKSTESAGNESASGYRHTLNLPDTPFPMRGNLPKQEPGRVKQWEDQGVYRRIRAVGELIQAQVRTGMSPDEVRLRIGTPLLADVFHPNRWEYVFRFQYPNGESELRRVTVFFADNRVTDIKHDPLPARDDPNDPALPGYQPKETEKS